MELNSRQGLVYFRAIMNFGQNLLNQIESYWWLVKDLNLRRRSRRIYSPLPLAARATRQGRTSTAANIPKRLFTIAPNGGWV